MDHFRLPRPKLGTLATTSAWSGIWQAERCGRVGDHFVPERMPLFKQRVSTR
jgi:hypothetical protein